MSIKSDPFSFQFLILMIRMRHKIERFSRNLDVIVSKFIIKDQFQSLGDEKYAHIPTRIKDRCYKMVVETCENLFIFRQ